MSINELVCVAGVAATVIVLVLVTERDRTSWRVPAALSAAFAGWSAYAVAEDGLFGFWPLHTASPWGAQVFLDLLLMAGVAWFALLPRLRAAGLNPWPWLAFVLATGSIGMLATLARLIHAEESTREPAPSLATR